MGVGKEAEADGGTWAEADGGTWAETGPAGDVAQLTRLWSEELGRLQRTWLQALLPAAEPPNGSPADEPSALSGFNDLYWDAYERTFGRLLESPSVGSTRELNEKVLKTMRSWVEFRRVSLEYQALLADAWVRAWDRFANELTSRAERGTPVASLRELLGVWSTAADGVMIEIFSSEPYARTQGRLVNAAMAYRVRERDAVDVFLRIAHVPTRREMDEVSKGMHELRKELRDVRRLLREERSGRAEKAAKARTPRS